MLYESVCRVVKKIRKRTSSTDPFETCRELGILINTPALGDSDDAIKGFYCTERRIRCITVNGSLPLTIQKIVAAHELGHAVLHAKADIKQFHDFGLFDESSIMEKEANLFAAEYLLDDEEVLETLNQDTTFFTAAAKLYVPMELLDFKFRVMKWKGYKLTEPPINARSNFLKDLEMPDDTDYYGE